MDNPGDITRLLANWGTGDSRAEQSLMTLVYDRLHQIAARELYGKRGAETLQPTGLINEAYVKLIGSQGNFENRAHFFAAAAQTMRRVLIDYYRAQGAAKRGGPWTALTLEEPLQPGAAAIDLSVLERALKKLDRLDKRKCRLAEMHYFAGMSYDEITFVEQLSRATVARELKFAKAWLISEIDA